MKKNFLTSVAFALVLGLVACDDSTSANGSSGDENPAEVSSSSVIASEAKQSSSSVVSSCSVASSSSVESSSSVVSSSSEKSSSSVASSSSVKSSSSSVKSSSSVASSSSTESSSSSVILSSSSEESSIKDGSEYNASANTLTDLRDNKVYKTVTIGTQTWMAENLNYAYTGVKYNYYSSYTSDSTSWCYENKAFNCDKYGRLYTWSAVMDSAAQFNVNAGTKCGNGKTCTPNTPHRGICPEGWHVPTNEEYSTLYTYIGGSSTAGSLLKSTRGWYGFGDGSGSDKYGVSVLPAGYWGHPGDFYNEGGDAYLWSASEDNHGSARYQLFDYNNGSVGRSSSAKSDGQSLRCLKD